jgi:SH3-like domain-containing protein
MQGNFSKLAATLALCVGLGGCHYLRVKPAETYVYVTAKQTFLRDRVAAVSNRTGTVNNGEKLLVLERARRFIKVQTPRGEVGWIEEKLTAGPEIADKFEALQKSHAKDPVVASATARDEVYLHIAPGRETDHFYRLAEGDALSLLERATVEKPAVPGAAVAKKPEAAASTGKAATGGKLGAPANAVSAVLEPPPMEDWWLVRDAKGETGWIYSHMIDVTAPDALSRYAEGQRIVGAYILAHADDPDSGMVDNGNTVTSIPEYLTVLGPYKAGLPYDFDQVRVFTWNTKKHRYETAFREHGIEGYLPVKIDAEADPYGKAQNAKETLPTFTYRVLAAGESSPMPDPETGEMKAGKTIAKVYRLEGNICRRILPPGVKAPEEAHPVMEEKKDAKKKKK